MPAQARASILILLCSIAVAGCGQPASDDAATSAQPDAIIVTDDSISVYTAAVDNSSRPDADRGRDASSQPAAVLEFLGIAPGMRVLDLFTGGGYYSEIIAGVVGADGSVISHSNKAYVSFVGEALEERFGSGRVANVEILMAENNELSLQADSLDAVFLGLAYHDLYLADADADWPRMDIPAFLAELRKGLKPGGIVGIVDHYVGGGDPEVTGETLHRIDPAVVIRDLEAAGFTLEEQSELLRNPDDDLSQSVFTPELRGKTDRFIMRFSSPD